MRLAMQRQWQRVRRVLDGRFFFIADKHQKTLCKTKEGRRAREAERRGQAASSADGLNARCTGILGKFGAKTRSEGGEGGCRRGGGFGGDRTLNPDAVAEPLFTGGRRPRRRAAATFAFA